MPDSPFHTHTALRADLHALGVAPGDLLMVHTSCRAVGPVLGGPDAIIRALRDAVGRDAVGRDAVGPAGTVMAYLDWDAPWEDLVDDDGAVLPEWRDAVMPFDPARTRAARYLGSLPEFLRTTPGALRSGNPAASVAAIGAQAEWLTADHPLDYGYGPGSPLAKLVAANGKVLMLGAPRDTMTLVHHAEHLARLPGKRIIRPEVPFATPTGITWRWIEEYETSEPVIDSLPDDTIARIVTAYLDSGRGRTGRVGAADSILVDAADIVPFAVDWLEACAGAV